MFEITGLETSGFSISLPIFLSYKIDNTLLVLSFFIFFIIKL